MSKVGQPPLARDMDLRDFFAAMVLAGPLMTGDGWGVQNERTAARLAYVIADAMLKERNGG